MAVFVEVRGDGHGGIHAVVVLGKGRRIDGKIAFTVIQEKAKLHLTGIGLAGIAAGTDEKVEVTVAVGIKEEYCFVFKVVELIETGFGLALKIPVGGLEVDLARMAD